MTVVGSLGFLLTSYVLDGVPEKLKTQMPMGTEERASRSPVLSRRRTTRGLVLQDRKALTNNHFIPSNTTLTASTNNASGEPGLRPCQSALGSSTPLPLSREVGKKAERAAEPSVPAGWSWVPCGFRGDARACTQTWCCSGPCCLLTGLVREEAWQRLGTSTSTGHRW